jgi:hypothetical protein
MNCFSSNLVRVTRLLCTWLLGAALAATLVACGGGGGYGGDGGANEYTIGGAVTGLSRTGLVLRNNGVESLSVPANGRFTFTAPVAAGRSYEVTVSAQPRGQTCTVSNGSGSASANITTVAVACVNSDPPPPPPPNTYTVGGMVSGLTGSGLVLQNNLANDRAISSNGEFGFSTRLASGAAYSVTVATQPSGQRCDVGNASGTVTNAVVNTVTVNCVAVTPPPPPPSQYTIGGTLSNYTGRDLVLQNNGGDGITIVSGATAFTFPARITGGTNYAVTIAGQPIGQDCTITNAAGTANANVSNVAVTCGPMAPLTVVSSSLADGATNVPRSVRPTLTFSDAVDPSSVASTVGSGIFEIVGNGTSPPRTATVNGTGVTFAPDRRLLPLTRYSLFVESDPRASVKGLRGQTVELATDREFFFTTADGAWQPTKLADRGFSGDANSRSSIAMDASGNAIAVWPSKPPGAALIGIYTSRYDAATATWSDVTPLAPDSAGDAFSPQVAMDSAGNAVAVWQQINAAVSNAVIFASRYDAASRQWGGREVVSHGDASTPREPSIVFHPDSGNFTAVWVRSDASLGQHVWTRRRSGGLTGTWSDSPVCVGPDPACDAPGPPTIVNLRVAAGGTDNRAIVTWEDRSADAQVWARPLRAGVFTDAARAVSHEDGTSEGDARAVFDRAGTAYVVWTQTIGSSSAIWLRRNDPGTGVWGRYELVTTIVSGNADSPRIASNAHLAGAGADSVWLVWRQATGPSRSTEVWGWKVGPTDPTVARRPIGRGLNGPSEAAQLAVDRAGNALAVWVQGTQFASSRYNALLDTWSEPLIDTTTDGRTASSIDLRINLAGDAVAWWLVSSDSRVAIQTRRFE